MNPDLPLLRIQPLTRIGFAPFGQVLDFIPGDLARRNFAAALFNGRSSAKPNLRVQRSDPTLLPCIATRIERHVHSSQLFAPLSGTPYLVAVFPSAEDGTPLLGEGSAFMARGDQAINYNRRSWHHAFTALERPGTFLMLRWDDGSSEDDEFLDLQRPIKIDL